MEEKERRIRAITRLYYSNPAVQKAILDFARNREVVPSYMMQSFGKRPDIIQYISDVNGLVRKGATSFHASEELWEDPLQLSSELTAKEMNSLRKGWDLLIDIDSKYLDVSKILTLLILDALESEGVKNYGLKFSGSKGMHIIVSGRAFPDEYDGIKMKESFPEWPRAICEYLLHEIRREYNKKISELLESSKTTSKDKKKKEALCPKCNRPAKKGRIVTLECPVCGTSIQRKDMKITKKRLKCIQEDCAGIFEIKNEKDYFECDYCKGVSSIDKMQTSGKYKTTFNEHAKKAESYAEELKEQDAGISYGMSDLVLVSPRHLFRMPYSLHEKTALASVVLDKNEIEGFNPGKDADPLKVKVREFMPKNLSGEAEGLLKKALAWKKQRGEEEKKFEGKKYESGKFKEIELGKVEEGDFPPAIKKLLKGLEDGRKRGLFVLITFLKAVGFSPEELNKKVREWNERNEPPLKEGYVRSQIDWHLKQRKKILPPNYKNDGFYRDIGLIDKLPNSKNPLVDVVRRVRKRDSF